MKKKRTTVLNKITHDRQITVKCNLQIGELPVSVCKQMFQNVFGCGRGKIDTMIHKKKTSKSGICNRSVRGKLPPHNLNVEKIIDIAKHIKSFPSYESHYSRKRTSLIYLSPLLNIQKMYELYKKDLSEKGIDDYASYWLYKDVFNEIGLKFKMPHVDTCKICDEYSIKSKQVCGEELEILTNKICGHAMDILNF